MIRKVALFPAYLAVYSPGSPFKASTSKIVSSATEAILLKLKQALDFINEFSSIVFPSSIISPISGKSFKDRILSKNG